MNNWDAGRTIYVKAASDDAAEGTKDVVISHSILSTNAHFDRLMLKNIKVEVFDDDLPELLITESDNISAILEGNEHTKVNDSYQFSLPKAPSNGEIVTVSLSYDSSQIGISSDDGRFDNQNHTVAFNETNWDIPIELLLEAENDNLAENPVTTVLTHTITSNGLVYANALDSEIKIISYDDETAGIFIHESDNTTRISQNGAVVDSYSIRLTKAPTEPVELLLRQAENTQLSSIDPRFTENDRPVVTFSPDDWHLPIEIEISATGDFTGVNELLKTFPLTPHLSLIHI